MSVALLVLVMILAGYRLTRLVVKDTFPPVLWLRDRLAGGWRPMTDAEWKILRTPASEKPWPTTGIDHVENRWVERVSWSPDWLAELITCPWCASGWITGGLTLVTDLTYGVPAPYLVGLAVWAGSALLAGQAWA